MPELWLLLSFDTQVQMAHWFKLPVKVVNTPWGPEVRLKGIYYGDDESLAEIDWQMRQPPKRELGIE